MIVRRYLSLLDAAVGLEYREYSGPRLQDAHKVLMFDHALTADEVNRKYRYEPSVRLSLWWSGWGFDSQWGHLVRDGPDQ